MQTLKITLNESGKATRVFVDEMEVYNVQQIKVSDIVANAPVSVQLLLLPEKIVIERQKPEN